MPAPDEITARQQLRNALQEYWGYDGFLPLQEQAMVAAMQQRDSLIVLPTGGGKSLCYQAPAMCLEGVTVVVSPLISLMKDQVDAANACGVPAAFLNSTQSMQDRRNVRFDLQAGKIKLLYIAPERLVGEEGLRELGDLPVSMFAIDEAHCVSVWGHDFRPHYRQLSRLRETFPDVSIHAFTATATERVRQDIVQQLQLHEPEILVGSFDRPNLTYRVARKQELAGQMQEVLERHRGESGIVYCITRKDVDEKAGLLKILGYKAAPYHAGLSDEVRKQNQEAFINEDVQIIVATVAFGMGIDKSNVRFVIHAGMPPSVENYQQESGRAGRDGLEAECCLFFGGDDLIKWEYIFKNQPDELRRASLKSLRVVQVFCEGNICRHQALVRHFAQELDADCGSACDVCLGEKEDVADALIVSQKILSSVHRQQQRFGAEYTALVLKGSNDKRILQNGHEKLSTWGLLKNETKQTLLDWIGQLVQQGFLIKEGEYNVLKISVEGGQVLRGEATPRLLKTPDAGQPSSNLAPKQLDPHSWEGVDRGLFEVLRELRLKLAKEKKVPPYVIFGDAPLRDLARRRPSSQESLLKVYGVGQRKAEQFGEQFLEVISKYAGEHSLSLDVDASHSGASRKERPKTKAASSPAKSLSTVKLQAFELFAQGKPLAEIAQEIQRAESTTRGYFTEYLAEKNITDASPWVSREIIQKVEAAIATLGPGPYKPLFDHLHGEVDYDTLRIVATCRKNRCE